MASELLEPEVLPPESKGEPKANKRPSSPWPLLLAAGLLVDLLGLYLAGTVGFAAGALAGVWVGRLLKANMPVQIISAIACGLYVASPLPVKMPVATLAVMVIRLISKG